MVGNCNGWDSLIHRPSVNNRPKIREEGKVLWFLGSDILYKLLKKFASIRRHLNMLEGRTRA